MEGSWWGEDLRQQHELLPMAPPGATTGGEGYGFTASRNREVQTSPVLVWF